MEQICSTWAYQSSWGKSLIKEYAPLCEIRFIRNHTKICCVLLCRTLVKAGWVTEQPQITDSCKLCAEIFKWLSYKSGLQLMVSVQFTFLHTCFWSLSSLSSIPELLLVCVTVFHAEEESVPAQVTVLQLQGSPTDSSCSRALLHVWAPTSEPVTEPWAAHDLCSHYPS